MKHPALQIIVMAKIIIYWCVVAYLAMVAKKT